MKKIILTVTCLSIILFPLLPNAVGKTKSYYSGDAISYNGKIYIGSTNMDGAEIFAVENNKISKKIKFSPDAYRYSGKNNFNDISFAIEAGNLYAYLVDGTYLYKYDLANPSSPNLVNQVKDNSWDWFYGLISIPNGIATVGSNGVKIFNRDLVVLDMFKIINPMPRNVSFSSGMKFLYNVNGDQIQIFNTQTRQIVNTININAKSNNYRQIIKDEADGSIYYVDNYSLNKASLSGEKKELFTFTTGLGYDVAKGVNGYLYFADGAGIVKIKQDDNKPLKWAYANTFGSAGSWSMGLKVLNNNDKEYSVVFNNSNIALLDGNLKKIDYFEAIDETFAPIEPISLAVDKNSAAPGSQVLLTGKGFGLNEDLEIYFDTQKTIARTDNQGKFSTILTVPSFSSSSLYKFTDIKVTGKISKVTYSTSFKIE